MSASPRHKAGLDNKKERTMQHLTTAALLAACIASAAAPLSRAQESVDAYPSKPVTIILASQGASSVDVEFRLYGQAIQEKTGKQFIIDYKGGGGGTIGIAHVAKAVPDGYTLHGATSALVTTPSMHDNLSYNVMRDFAPVSLMTKHVFLLVVHPSAPFRSAKDYIEYARTHPGELLWGTAGLGGSSHMPGALLHSMSKTQVTYVHYKQASQRFVDLMAGRTHVTAVTPVTGMANVKAGKLKVLGISGATRSPAFPDIPTIAEQAVPGYEFTSWVGLVAPAKVPPAFVRKVSAMFVEAGKDPDVIKKIQADGTIMVNSSPEEYRKFLVSELARWGKVIREGNIKAGQEN
jgi:tripartite-type tricarboxylate transporter receptor subunit TctC